jgi:transforming growth factor-beta-induced protein
MVISIAVFVVAFMSLASAMPEYESIIDTTLDANTNGPLAGQFDILVQALQAEGELIEQLDRRSQYTVFAPTDDAFMDLFAELNVTPAQVLGDQALLTNVLEYHVLRGNREVVSITSSKQVRTLSKGFVFVDGTVLTDQQGRDVNIIAVDVDAGNGVIHVVDRVLLP